MKFSELIEKLQAACKEAIAKGGGADPEVLGLIDGDVAEFEVKVERDIDYDADTAQPFETGGYIVLDIEI